MILHKGEVLFRQGELGPLYRVIRGLLKVVRIQEDGSIFMFNIILPEEVIPHHSLISPQEYHGSAIALTDCEIEIIPADTWYNELTNNPYTYRQVALLLQTKLRMMQQRIDQLMPLSPMERVMLLQQWFKEYFPDAHLNELLTQEEIAQFIGLRRETVNRILRKMNPNR